MNKLVLSKNAVPTTSTRIDTPQNYFLRHSQKQFFTLSFDSVFILGLDGRFQQANSVAQETLGFTAEELLKKSWQNLIHPEDYPLFSRQWQEFTTTTQNINFETRCRCQDGSYKWLLWNVTFDSEEELIYAIARDVTQVKEADAVRRQTETLFRLLVNSVKDYAIYMLDSQGRVMSWNQGAERTNGFTASEIIGQHVSCFHPQDEVQQGRPQEVLDIAATHGCYEYETWRLRKDGSKFWADVVITALKDDAGHLTGFATVTRDITERKQAQEALKSARDELEKRVKERTTQLQQKTTELEAAMRELQDTQAQLIHAEKICSLGQLVAGIAHEINNPISFIYGNVDHAKAYTEDLMQLCQLYSQHFPNPPTEIEEFIDTIELDFILKDLPKVLSSMKIGAERISKLILSLRNFSRHDEAEKKVVNLHQGIDSTLEMLQSRLKGKGKQPKIQVVKKYRKLPLIECYAGQLNQVLMNILSNAIDVLEEKDADREITVSTQMSADKDKVLISIADNGKGIPQELQNRIFDPFFTTKGVGKGVGLSLAVSFQIIVEKHGGKLSFSSQPNQGTEFVIEIPIRQSQTEHLLWA